MSDALRRPVSDLPFATATPGLQGRLRSCPEDFRVKELPLYEASGDGEHAMLLIEKRELTTPTLIGLLADALGISERDVGVAGRKDSYAVTSQFVTVPARSLNSLDPEAIESQCGLDERLHPGQSVRVLSAARHRNKLKTAHLSGNRFQILLRLEKPSEKSALEAAEATCEVIRRTGFVNYFGEQRFGHSNRSDEEGLQLLRDEKTRRLNRATLRFTLSAVQSRLFNEWAARRITDSLTQTILPGDVMQVVESGGCFVVDPEHLAEEQTRFDSRETVLTGPMFGPKMKPPTGEAAEREAVILQLASLTGREFEKFRKVASGARRPFLVWPKDLTVKEVAEAALQFSFTLPAGAYATSLLREITK